MSHILGGISRLHMTFAVLAGAAFVFLVTGQTAHAAADPTTGIDYKVDVAEPALNAAKPALLAGLAVMVLVIAVSLGKKLWGKVSGAR